MLSLDNAECNGETKTAATGRTIAGRLTPLEGFEDGFSLLRGNARPFIVNDDLGHVIGLARRDMGNMAVTQGISNDVGERTRECHPITPHEKCPFLTGVECNFAPSHSRSLHLVGNE